MQYMVKCTRQEYRLIEDDTQEKVVFIGPFHNEKAAERWLMLPTGFGFLVRNDDFCDGNHEIVELIAPDHERKFSEMAVYAAIERALEAAK